MDRIAKIRMGRGTTLSALVLAILLGGCLTDGEPTDPENVGTSRAAISGPGYSCDGRCGEGIPTGNLGCSCEADCDYAGTCCRDVRTYCPQYPRNYTALDYVTMNQPVSAVRGPNQDIAGPLQHTSLVTQEGDYSFTGLTTVNFGDIDSRGEQSACHTFCDNSGCYVRAEITNDDNRAACEAAAIRNDGRWGQLQGPIDWVVARNGQVRTTCLGGSMGSHLGVLVRVELEDLDDPSEWGGCEIDHVGGSCGWQLTARADGDSDAHCYAQLLTFQNGMERVGRWSNYEYTHQSNNVDPGGTISWLAHKKKYRAINKTQMMPTHQGMCFLAKVHLKDLDNGAENAGCRLVSENGYWSLWADVSGWDGEGDADVECAAECVSMPDRADRWPPKPTVYTAGGEHLILLLSGIYDKPVVFVEGFDPSNKQDHNYYMRWGGELFETLLGNGYDIVMVDLADGGQDLRNSAVDVAQAIDFAHRFGSWDTQHPGQEIAVVGVSMGAVISRIALASWEDGMYASTPGYYSATLGSDPPVATFISHVGPHHGANMPRSIQIAVQDYGDVQDIGESMLALNSHAAVNMLRERVDRRCYDVVADFCEGGFWGGLLAGVTGTHGDWTIRDGATHVYGDECSLDYTGCLAWEYPQYPYPSACLEYGTPHAAFYADINSRGLDNNGWPQTVHTVGMASSGWQSQGCSTNAPGTCFEPFNASPIQPSHEMARLELDDSGHSGILSFCDRNATVSLYPRPNDLVPGDLTERTFNDLNLMMPREATADIKQNFNMMFVPTDSALGCDGAYNDSTCASSTRFDEIYRMPNNKNHIHGALVDSDGNPTLVGVLLGTLANTYAALPGTTVHFPARVTECPGLTGALDSIDHPIGQYECCHGGSGEDIRAGTCNPNPACATGGTSAYGVDLEFDLGLPAGSPITSASMRIRAVVNNGETTTFAVKDPATGGIVGQCTIAPGSQSWDECTALLDTSYIDTTTTYLAIDVMNNPAPCYIVYDFAELTIN